MVTIDLAGYLALMDRSWMVLYPSRTAPPLETPEVTELLTPLECARLFLKAWEDSSPLAISRLFADDGVFTNPLQPKPLIGPSEIFEAVSVGLSKIENVTIRVTSSFEQGCKACIEGEFLSHKRTDGSRFDFPFSLVLEMRDGRIERLSEYFDTAGLR